MRAVTIVRSSVAATLFAYAAAGAAEPKVIVISLDGAAPRLLEAFMRDGTIPRDRGLALLAREGAWAERNITVNPSLTAPSHIAIATGSIAARNDIGANTFHLHATRRSASSPAVLTACDGPRLRQGVGARLPALLSRRQQHTRRHRFLCHGARAGFVGRAHCTLLGELHPA
jgi:Type I phosphodiesterase / nucleotide pyrophosphatase